MVCGLHFKSEDFDSSAKFRRLKRDAIPSIFSNYPLHKQPKTSKRRHVERFSSDDAPKKRRNNQDECETTVDSDTETILDVTFSGKDSQFPVVGEIQPSENSRSQRKETTDDEKLFLHFVSSQISFNHTDFQNQRHDSFETDAVIYSEPVVPVCVCVCVENGRKDKNPQASIFAMEEK